MTRDEILAAFAALDRRLSDRHERLTIDIVGGAVMALVYGAREATRDVDASRIHPPAPASWTAISAEVGQELSLASTWLNADASGFAMQPTSGPAVFQGVALTVYAAPVEQMAGMKLSALRDDVDFDDLRTLVATMAGDRETWWQRIQPHLIPGQESYRRTAFDAAWRDSHGPA